MCVKKRGKKTFLINLRLIISLYKPLRFQVCFWWAANKNCSLFEFQLACHSHYSSWCNFLTEVRLERWIYFSNAVLPRSNTHSERDCWNFVWNDFTDLFFCRMNECSMIVKITIFCHMNECSMIVKIQIFSVYLNSFIWCEHLFCFSMISIAVVAVTLPLFTMPSFTFCSDLGVSFSFDTNFQHAAKHDFFKYNLGEHAWTSDHRSQPLYQWTLFNSKDGVVIWSKNFIWVFLHFLCIGVQLKIESMVSYDIDIFQKLIDIFLEILEMESFWCLKFLNYFMKNRWLVRYIFNTQPPHFHAFP